MNKNLNKVLRIFLVFIINLIQLFQALSFLKKAAKSDKWDSNIINFIDACKIITLRLDNEPFIVLYIISSSICTVSVLLYILFYDQIHKNNQNFSVFSLFQWFVEYIIFTIGFIPMTSKFIEVQLCNNDYKIQPYHQVSCFDKSQMVMLQVGFVCIGITFIVNSIVIPALKHERNGIEQLWSSENYFEGVFYLILFSAESFIGFIQKPWVGILICGMGFVYGLIYECYRNLYVACSRCSVIFSLMWAYTAAYVLEHDANIGNILIYLLPVGYFSGFFLKFFKERYIKRKFNKVKIS